MPLTIDLTQFTEVIIKSPANPNGVSLTELKVGDTVVWTSVLKLIAPVITDAMLSQGRSSIDMWVQNNNSVDVVCHVIVYDGDGADVGHESFTIEANTSTWNNVLIASSAVLPLECYLFFEADYYEYSDEVSVEVY